MDGLEWKRTKYNDSVKKFLLFAERLAIKSSDSIVADSVGIKEYLDKKYDIKSTFIPYGAEIFNERDENILSEYNLDLYNYDMLIARMEPENNIEMILQGVIKTKARKFIVIGSTENKYGTYIRNKFESDYIIFLGPVYNILVLNNLRYFSNLYFHGHSVGGTNPSLLEAMGSNCLISANKNIFNQSILGEDALYFSNSNEVADSLFKRKKDYLNFITNNSQKIREIYSHDHVYTQYEELLKKICF